MRKFLALAALALAAASFLPAQSGATPSISYKTAGMRKMAGYFPLYWDAQTGKLWLEIDKFEQEFLYVVGLPAGVGSNDIGLDRGQLGPSRIVRFERSGNKVFLVQRNYRFRALTDNADERRAVEEAFAQSVVWGGEVAAGDDGGRVLVEATALFLRTRMTWPAHCSAATRASSSWIRPGALSICRARETSRTTPRWRRR